MRKEDKTKLGIFILFFNTIAFWGLLLFMALNPVVEEKIEDYYVVESFEKEYSLHNFEESYQDMSILVTVTKYNPTVSQCDSDPLITADGSYIDTVKLNKGELKWIAISRDLRSDFQYGDTVILSGIGTDEEFVVRDTMNPRWRLRVDILSPVGDSLGKWENIHLYKK